MKMKKIVMFAAVVGKGCTDGAQNPLNFVKYSV
jgi:hypothetical protein